MKTPSDIDVLVVGAGFAGMYAIHKLREAGLSFRVIEKGEDVGGTWYWNRYPGCRCDIPSVDYSYTFSPELDQEWHWPEIFSAQPDILRYAMHVADKFDMRKDITFNTSVTSLHFDEEGGIWHAETDTGEQITATYCLMATGSLSTPMKPDIPGVDSFTGEELHTALWPQNGADLKGKRVGVIGTGSSGVQTIPEVAKEAGELYVFQRTPAYSAPAFNKETDPEYEQAVKKYYPQIREIQKVHPRGVANYTHKSDGNYSEPEINFGVTVSDGKSNFRGVSGGNLMDMPAEARTQLIEKYGPIHLFNFKDIYDNQEANDVASDLFRDYVKRVVKDPETAKSLTPTSYGIACKRPVLDKNYYQTFNQDHVHLVDLKAEPIEEMTAGGIRTTKSQYDLDVMIYATGFDAVTGTLSRIDICGRNNVSLKEKWQNGPTNYLGLQVSGFPNLFMVSGPGSPSVLANMIACAEQHIDWITQCITDMQKASRRTIEATPDAETKWGEHVNEIADGTAYTASTCNSWYLGANVPGKPRGILPYTGGLISYRESCDDVVQNDYAGFQFT